MNAKKILIIEDAKDLLLLYTRFLQNTDYEIATASSAHQALQYLEKNTPDLILMDLTFPDMSTMDFCEKFTALSHLDQVKKILISGRDDLKTWVDVFNAQEGLRKPVERATMAKAVTTHLP
ncbi:response regulator [Bdellovibrio sp. ArHS]|uniref:response regulator n=1 Tax=Bdellovibrio sp. ArHS TaxID=1569284 RepID=UPI000AC3B1C9|nr:response regulator [Bdellovibrio sp. ArHS]